MPSIAQTSSLLNSHRQRIVAIGMLLACILMWLSLVAPTFAATATVSAATVADDAEKFLDSWRGERGILIEANKKIVEALNLEPKYPNALVQQGRLLIMAGYSGGTLDPAAAADAEKSFLAAAADTKYAKAQILLGHLYTVTDRLPEAKDALMRADATGSEDPWLQMNWASYYDKMGDASMKAKYSQQAIATGTQNTKVLLAAYGSIHKYYSDIELDRKKADESYLKLIQLNPSQAFYRGNYARDLVVNFLDPEAGASLAKEALAIRDYPHARQTLSLAHYVTWAIALKAGRDQAKTKRLFQEATAYDPGGRNIPGCALGYPAMKVLVDALKSQSLWDVPHQSC